MKVIGEVSVEERKSVSWSLQKACVSRLCGGCVGSVCGQIPLIDSIRCPCKVFGLQERSFIQAYRPKLQGEVVQAYRLTEIPVCSCPLFKPTCPPFLFSIGISPVRSCSLVISLIMIVISPCLIVISSEDLVNGRSQTARYIRCRGTFYARPIRQPPLTE